MANSHTLFVPREWEKKYMYITATVGSFEKWVMDEWKRKYKIQKKCNMQRGLR